MNADTFSEKILNAIELVEKNNEGYSVEKPNRYRLDFALNLLKGNSVLDIGIAEGILTRAACDLENVNKVTGVDIQWHSKLERKSEVNYVRESILSEKTLLEPHDTVYCMEVIEHLPVKENVRILDRLRSLTRQRLVISVPYLEPEPLWWHDRPGGHRQRFTMDKLSEMFPTAAATFIPRYGVDWVIIIEDKVKKADRFSIFSRKDLKQYLE